MSLLQITDMPQVKDHAPLEQYVLSEMPLNLDEKRKVHLHLSDNTHIDFFPATITFALSASLIFTTERFFRGSKPTPNSSHAFCASNMDMSSGRPAVVTTVIVRMPALKHLLNVLEFAQLDNLQFDHAG